MSHLWRRSHLHPGDFAGSVHARRRLRHLEHQSTVARSGSLNYIIHMDVCPWALVATSCFGSCHREKSGTKRGACLYHPPYTNVFVRCLYMSFRQWNMIFDDRRRRLVYEDGVQERNCVCVPCEYQCYSPIPFGNV